jgi:hypothetical protein
VKLRYKDPDGRTSHKLEWPLTDTPAGSARSDLGSADFKFATAVAAFAMILRQSPLRGFADRDMVLRLAEAGLGRDPGGHRRRFLDLVKRVDLPPHASHDEGRERRLVVSQEGRPEISVAVDNGHVSGRVGGEPFDLAVKGAVLEGHVAGEPLSLWMHGREAEGHIGGHDVGFVLAGTPTGHLLRGISVGSAVRLEESAGSISWLPSCERPLVRLPSTSAPVSVYQGTCASGRRMHLVLPRALDELADLPRMIVMSLVLIEPDEPGARPLFRNAVAAQGGR